MIVWMLILAFGIFSLKRQFLLKVNFLLLKKPFKSSVWFKSEYLHVKVQCNVNAMKIIIIVIILYKCFVGPNPAWF